jgi:hypothetical protein
MLVSYLVGCSLMDRNTRGVFMDYRHYQQQKIEVTIHGWLSSGRRLLDGTTSREHSQALS